VGQPEPATDDPAVPEELFDLVRVSVRADVKVLWTPAEQHVPDTPADQIRGVPVVMKPVEDL
jgi:hypothetical protein